MMTDFIGTGVVMMTRSLLIRLLAAAGLLAPQGAAAQLGDRACAGSGSAVLVTVTGLKPSGGRLRVQAYGADPDKFLKKGEWIRRADVALGSRTSATVCLALPQAGRYAIAVRHDANASGKSDWNDGGGFSRNPKLSLLNYKPRFENAVVTVPEGVLRLKIVMNYRRGLSIGPLR